MTTNQLRELVERNKGAARRAVNTLLKAQGYSTDPDVRLYNRLTEVDFDRILAEQGEDALLEYITEMERRRLEGPR